MKKLFLFFVISLFVGFISCEKDELVKPDPDPVPNKNVEVIVNIVYEEGIENTGASGFGVIDKDENLIVNMEYLFPQSKVAFPEEMANEYFGKTVKLYFRGVRVMHGVSYGCIHEISFLVKEKNVINITFSSKPEYYEIHT